MRRTDRAQHEASTVVASSAAVGAVCRSAQPWLPMALDADGGSTLVSAAVKGASSMV
jgi:hypothetical protein